MMPVKENIIHIGLVNTEFETKQESLVVPLTMYYIGGVLRENGYEISIVDPTLHRTGKVEKTMNEKLDDLCSQCNVIAFTTNTFNWAIVLNDIIYLRKNGYTGKIVIGGVHASLAYQYIMEKYHEYIDFIVLGDAEIALVELLKNLNNAELYYQIPGIVYYDNNKVHKNPMTEVVPLSELCYTPAYDLLPSGVYDTITFECSRGCQGRCSFCTIPFKRSWRGYSEAQIRDNLKEMLSILNKKINKKSIIITDDCFTTNPKRAVRILEIFREYGLEKYNILIEARIIDLECDALVNELLKFPNITIQIGVESGYDEGLKKIHKPVTVKKLYSCCERLYRCGLNKNAYYSFIIAMPYENIDDCNKTMNTIKEVNRKFCAKVSVAFWLPLPSEAFEILREMQKDISYEIYDMEAWHMNKDIFYKTHPLINKKEYYSLKSQVYDVLTKGILKED